MEYINFFCLHHKGTAPQPDYLPPVFAVQGGANCCIGMVEWDTISFLGELSSLQIGSKGRRSLCYFHILCSLPHSLSLHIQWKHDDHKLSWRLAWAVVCYHCHQYTVSTHSVLPACLSFRSSHHVSHSTVYSADLELSFISSTVLARLS